MDYSHVSSDLDHPGGSSPWANTSPRADRAFAHVTGESPPSPPSPASGPEHSPLTSRSNPSATDQYQIVSDLKITAGGPVSAEDDVDSPDLSEQLQSAQLGDSDYIGEHERSPYDPPQIQQYTPEPQRPAASRYQQGQKPQRPVPAYKLQAKITALERSGRKDPVLRFDVHVRRSGSIFFVDKPC